MKKKRHEALLKIINNNSISTQADLQAMLSAEGFETTQATISRDIKDLNIVKKADKLGRSCYCVNKADDTELSTKYNSVFAHSVISVNYAGNMVSIKCYTGMANAACAALDSMNLDGVIGTLAGDDTIFVLCTLESTASGVKNKIEDMIS